MTQTHVNLTSRVRQLLADRLNKVLASVSKDVDVARLVPTRILPTRLAEQLAAGGCAPLHHMTLERACVATEMAHIATRCHDDVIDSPLIRRAGLTQRKNTTCSAAILIGDLLLCEAMELLLITESGRYLAVFVSKIQEVCRVQTEQQLEVHRKPLDEHTRLRLAWGKTGSLFAFVGHVCGGDDTALSAALEEAGYCLGTACQLADHLFEATCDKRTDEKTVSRETKCQKNMFSQLPRGAQHFVREQIRELCDSALDCLKTWPHVRTALARFAACHLQRDLGRSDRACPCDAEDAVRGPHFQAG